MLKKAVLQREQCCGCYESDIAVPRRPSCGQWLVVRGKPALKSYKIRI